MVATGGESVEADVVTKLEKGFELGGYGDFGGYGVGGVLEDRGHRFQEMEVGVELVKCRWNINVGSGSDDIGYP